MRSATTLRALMDAIAKALDDAIAGSERERHDAERGGLVRGGSEHARIANVQIRHVVRLPEAIGDEMLRVVAHSTGAALMQAPAGNERCLAAAFVDTAGCTD